MGTGDFILGAALFDRSQSDARKAKDSALYYARQSGEMEGKYNRYVFAAKSHVHGLRAQVYAHEITEEKLIAALKAENANHPLASREAVDAAVEDMRVKALVNADVIKRTYPDGKLPEGAVVPPDLVQTIA